MAADLNDSGGRQLAEPVAAWRAWPRKLRAFSTVSRRSAGPASTDELRVGILRLRDLASAESSLPTRIWTLWKAEGLAYAHTHRCFERVDFRGADLPLEAGPPLQCGLSMGAVLHFGFDISKLEPWLHRCADERFVDFGFESIGLMLAAYERDLFGLASGAMAALHLVRRPSMPPPRPAEVLAQLEPPQRRLAAHGYGRLLYFKSSSLQATINAIERRAFLPRDSAVKGAVAAYVLVNSNDLDAILDLYDSRDEAITAGLDNVLTLLAWAVPDALENLGSQRHEHASRLATLSEKANDRRREGLGPDMVA